MREGSIGIITVSSRNHFQVGAYVLATSLRIVLLNGKEAVEKSHLLDNSIRVRLLKAGEAVTLTVE